MAAENVMRRATPLTATALALMALPGAASADGYGAAPTLSPPQGGLVPTVDIATVAGWAADETPAPAAGFSVERFADGLDHPRWLYVLPNGDVLVAETNAPPKETTGIKSFVMQQVQKVAGAGTPSANRITLLRDGDGDGRAETRSVFLENLFSPFGMALVGGDLYVANADAVMRFPYEPGQQRITAQGVQPPRSDLVEKAVAPDYALGSHTASLGLAFYDGTASPERYRGGAFVGQHGSWNRSEPVGYKVVFVPFADGRRAGPPEGVLTGFLNADGQARGRPVGVVVDAKGGLLVADDVGNVIWWVTANRD